MPPPPTPAQPPAPTTITPSTADRSFTTTRYALLDSDDDSDDASFHTAHENIPRTPQHTRPVPGSITPNTPATDNVSEMTEMTLTPTLVPRLSPQERRLVHSVLHSEHLAPTHRVSPLDTLPVSLASLSTLRPGRWLNDEVINAHIRLLIRRDDQVTRLTPGRLHNFSFSTQFYSVYTQQRHSDPTLHGIPDYALVSRWGAQSPHCNIFRLHRLLIPVNPAENHWSSVIVNFTDHTIRYYDSLHSPGMNHVQNVYQYLQAEHRRLNDGASLPDMWRLIPGDTTTTPRQLNGFDCGVYTCIFFDLILQGIQLQVTPTDVAIYRTRVALSIINGSAGLL